MTAKKDIFKNILKNVHKKNGWLLSHHVQHRPLSVHYILCVCIDRVLEVES